MKLKYINLMKHYNKAQFVKCWTNNELYVNNYIYIYIKSKLMIFFTCTTVQYFLNTLIQQGCIKLFKSDSINIYNVSKDFYFK